MKVIVYVEGEADCKALDALFQKLKDQARQKGAGISFVALGDKDRVLCEAPKKAALHLKQEQNRDHWVFALPDLHPMGEYDGNPALKHSSATELKEVLRKQFAQHADEVGLRQESRGHFAPHCLKHDLEALLLAVPDRLRKRLKTEDKLTNTWRKPVEEQNDREPPKRVVEKLFEKYRKNNPPYKGTTDAPVILDRANLDDIEKACRQCFAPFVSDLRTAIGISQPSVSGAKGLAKSPARK
ncbi:MAG: DUF4276 family protein [Planctomycetes bacterium]|nr:DUF4276 family protein [Planctomycetota bacterium]